MELEKAEVWGQFRFLPHELPQLQHETAKALGIVASR